MLCAVESSGTHGLRLTLARQLAEVLLRGYTGIRYTPPGTSKSSHKVVVDCMASKRCVSKKIKKDMMAKLISKINSQCF